MNGHQLQPELLTVGELFDDHDAVYTVPLYQRNFSWRAEQIEQLLDDIQDAVEGPAESYFLGNLIVTERRQPVRDFEVIDGQQRLTTLYLLLTVLAADGESRSDTFRDRLRYESRPRATQALRRVASAGSLQTASVPDEPSAEDAGIHEGYNVIRQFVNQHQTLRTSGGRGVFADFLRTKVSVVRASLPPGTDLNRYFEIMNTRGQQLQQVDIVKAGLTSRLPDDRERACFAWIWDACADMESYVQMSLTRGDTKRRDQVFGHDWSWLTVTSFEKLAEIQSPDASGPSSGTAPQVSASIEDALARYAVVGAATAADDPQNVRFRSTIEFPAFLLHVLKVLDRDDDELEGGLDDKRLIKLFGAAVAEDAAQWVRDFAIMLLRCRNLFDGFVLKRQYTATNSDDGDWSLQRLVRRDSGGRSNAGYVNTFSKVTPEVEEDGDVDPLTDDLLLLESMLRVTYTAPRTMHWITKLLALTTQDDPGTESEGRLADLLRGYARDKVREAFFVGEQPDGFSISRIVFTYLDYLLLPKDRQAEFRFAFRNSIEHFYPQQPNEHQSGDVVSPGHRDLLGNLALVSVSANSKFSNSLPKAKAENFKDTIEKQSPKLHEMASITRREGWRDPQVKGHDAAMVRLLRDDLGLAPSSC